MIDHYPILSSEKKLCWIRNSPWSSEIVFMPETFYCARTLDGVSCVLNKSNFTCWWLCCYSLSQALFLPQCQSQYLIFSFPSLCVSHCPLPSSYLRFLFCPSFSAGSAYIYALMSFPCLCFLTQVWLVWLLTLFIHTLTMLLLTSSICIQLQFELFLLNLCLSDDRLCISVWLLLYYCTLFQFPWFVHAVLPFFFSFSHLFGSVMNY